MLIYFLGTGSSFPTPTRGVSSLALRLDDGSVWLFDCGEGTQILLQKAPLSSCKINKIFITHLHGDHLFGLPGLLCTISTKLSENAIAAKSLPILDIYGPLGLKRFIFTTLTLSWSLLNVMYRVHEFEPDMCQFNGGIPNWLPEQSSSLAHPSELEGSNICSSSNSHGELTWHIFETDHYKVEAGLIKHTIPCFGFVIKEKDKVGTLLTKKLKTLGIPPGPLYGKLKSGQCITSESGINVRPCDVIGPSIRGRTVVILGDTCDASPMAHLVEGCDVLVHEATHDNSLHDKSALYGHSTPSGAAKMALKLGAKTLILNHFSQRYRDCDDQEENVTLLKKQAEEALGQSDIKVVLSSDLFPFEIKRVSRDA